MPRCRVDSSLKRVEIDGFAFPLGSYPVEPLTPKPGYTLAFEPADGDDSAEGDWEEWPDRYVFDILVPFQRVEAFCRALFSTMPGRVFPILDILGHDAYREVDPYVTYDLVGQERFMDALRRYHAFFYEDGLVGFGAMSEEPFVYVFVDEHKIVTVRVEVDLKPKIEAILQAFDLEVIDELSGADAVTHEHRGVLDSPADRLDLLSADEIIEDLRDQWGLVLNIDREANVDDDGNALGITAWRSIVRLEPPLPTGDNLQATEESNSSAPSPGTGTKELARSSTSSPAAAPGTPGAPATRYMEIILTAASLAAAEDMSLDVADEFLAQEADKDPTASPKTPSTDPSSKSSAQSTPKGAGFGKKSRISVRDPDADDDFTDPEGGDGGEGDEEAGEPVFVAPPAIVIAAERITPEQFTQDLETLKVQGGTLAEERVWHATLAS